MQPSTNSSTGTWHFRRYSQWADSIAKLEKMPCDVFLGAHSWFFNLTGKYKKLQANPKENPYIDAAGYKKFVAEMKTTREKLIKEQTAAGPPPPRGGGAGGQGQGQGQGQGGGRAN